MLLKPLNLPSSELAYTNQVFLNRADHQNLLQRSRKTSALYVSIKDYIFAATAHDGIKDGIGLSKFQRELLRISLTDTISVDLFQVPDDFYIGSLHVQAESLSKKKKLEVTEEEFEAKLREVFENIVINTGQVFLLDYQSVAIQVKILKQSKIDLIDPKPKQDPKPSTKGFIHTQTSFQIESLTENFLEIAQSKLRTVNIFDESRFNFEELGIGGLDREFALIFRRAFASRLFPPQVVKKLGIQHVRGMLLYGPPGTGKTLIARQIAKCLKAREPKIVNGPEVFDKYVGQTEANIRDLFKEAEEEQTKSGDKSKLHIIVLDEMDAIARPRGTVSGGTNVHDTAVNQLLSKIDGVNSLNNILLIGMTNRKDMIDEAILRPGRLEMHVEIGLPDEAGRVQIINIHTKTMRENNIMASDFDSHELARLTKNYSGAEIAGLVKATASYVFNREIDFENLGKEVNIENLKVGMNDFLSALKDIKPQFGVDEEDLTRYIRGGVIDYGDEFSHMYHTIEMLINQVKTSQQTPLLSVLLEGPSGCGKTALAAKIALESGFSYVKIISPENFVAYTESGKLSAIAKVFDDAYKSPLSLIVLDNIERLIDYVNSGPRFSNSILQAILILTKKIPPRADRRIFIMGTTAMASFLEDLDLIRSFNVVIEVKKLKTHEQIGKVLRKYKVSREEIKKLSSEHIEVPIKTLMLATEMTTQGGSDFTAEKFLECLNSILL
jgi:vesicle-fusing ATPase